MILETLPYPMTVCKVGAVADIDFNRDFYIGIFAISTFNTDYILVKAENFGRPIEVLTAEGYAIAE